jgi:hypothetical protein
MGGLTGLVTEMRKYKGDTFDYFVKYTVYKRTANLVFGGAADYGGIVTYRL